MTDYVHKNKLAWDSSAHLHKSSARWDALCAGFASPGYATFDPTATACLTQIGLTGKSVAQLGCNNGRETISLLNLGASSATGFDQSTAFLDQARTLAQIANKPATFVEANILDLPADYTARFDLVVITIGVLNWLPDLQTLFDTIRRILAPGGQVFIYETHPILDIFEPDAPDPFRAELSYFRKEPYIEDKAITYTGQSPDSTAPSYWFFHPIGDVITNLLQSGLNLRHFKEYPHSNREELYDIYAQRDAKLPMCFTLIAQN